MPNPVVDKSKCKGDFLCVEVCPVSVFEKDEKNKKVKVVKPNECIGCRACEAQCPEGAIKIED